MLVLVFYLTAVRNFDYTPDSTYATAQVAQNVEHWNTFAGPAGLVEGTSPSPLWVLFQAAGIRASIDGVLFAKVFGIFFCCAVLVFGYLTAFEVTDDRLLAFCASFVLATAAWLLFLAPTGSALPVALALTLGCFFFMLRNEYLLSSVLAGLTTLVLWEGVLLFVLVVADLMLNTVVPRRAYRVVGIGALVYAVVLTPWILYARVHGSPILPMLVPVGDVPVSGSLTLVSTLLLAALAVGGIGISLRGTGGWIHVRTHAAPIVWTAMMLTAGLLGSWETFVLAAPLLIIGAFVGIQRGMRAVHRPRAIYSAAFGLAAAMLLISQITYLGTVKPALQESVEAARDLDAISAWIKVNVADSVRVASEHAGALGYRSGRAVEPLTKSQIPTSDLVITSRDELRGYVRLYVVSSDSEVTAAGSRFSIWKKQ
jgi:hypothetical protein